MKHHRGLSRSFCIVSPPSFPSHAPLKHARLIPTACHYHATELPSGLRLNCHPPTDEYAGILAAAERKPKLVEFRHENSCTFVLRCNPHHTKSIFSLLAPHLSITYFPAIFTVSSLHLTQHYHFSSNLSGEFLTLVSSSMRTTVIRGMISAHS